MLPSSIYPAHDILQCRIRCKPDRGSVVYGPHSAHGSCNAGQAHNHGDMHNTVSVQGTNGTGPQPASSVRLDCFAAHELRKVRYLIARLGMIIYNGVLDTAGGRGAVEYLKARSQGASVGRGVSPDTDGGVRRVVWSSGIYVEVQVEWDKLPGTSRAVDPRAQGQRQTRPDAQDKKAAGSCCVSVATWSSCYAPTIGADHWPRADELLAVRSDGSAEQGACSVDRISDSESQRREARLRPTAS